jgi:AraC-like DNA-binding protein
MVVDLNLINHSPISNREINNHFSWFPIYVREHQLRYHQKGLHTQPGLEISFSHTGRAAFVAGDQVYMQNAGSLIMLPGHIPHQIFIAPDMKYHRTVLCIDVQSLQNQTGDGLHGLLESDWFLQEGLHDMKLLPETFTEFIRLTHNMIDEMKRQRSGWRRMVLSHLMGISVLLQRTMEEDAQLQAKESYGLKGQELVALCCRYIEENLQEDLSLQKVAKRYSVSPEHLTRLFRKERGISFYHHVLQQRILRSQRLLLTFPELSITDVAGVVGFSSSIQFSRMFRRFLDQSPTEFRERSDSGSPI